MRSFIYAFSLAALSVAACNQSDGESDAEVAESAVSRQPEGASCKTSADCAIGAKYCVPNAAGQLVCQAKVDTGYDACGKVANELGVGRACQDNACAGNPRAAQCVAAPALATTFCSRTCTADTECGSNAFCGKTSEASGNVCIPLNCACAAMNETTTLVSQAMAQGSKTACDVGQRFGALSSLYPENLAHDPLRPAIYQRLYHAPMAIPPTGKQLAAEARMASTSGAYVSGVIRLGARLWDEELGAKVSPPRSTASFEAAVAALAGAGADTTAIATDASDLPAPLKTELAPILAAVKTAIDLRNEAIPAGADLDRWFRAPMGMFQQMNEVVSRADKVDFSRPEDKAFMFDGFRYDLIARAAVVVSEAIEASKLRAQASTFGGTFAFNQPTPFGRIVIRGSGNDDYLASDASIGGDLLLVVDTGGNDRYEIPVGGTQGPKNPVSIAIDLGGADTYSYAKASGVPGDANERPVSDAAGRKTAGARQSLSEVRRQGSGSLGVGMLIDFGTADDLYESLRFSQGSGMMGVGVLYDEGGNDTYRAESFAQGGAHFGLGILIDGGGNDLYHGYSVMQGAAHVKGVGMLVDYAGDDTYWTSPGNSYFSVREGGHDYFYEYGINQGAAWGRRADRPMDGVPGSTNLSGGVGALLDLGGADSYTCGAFCQGMGYWFGTGILWDDGAGNDKSYGRMFAAGSGIHMGVGVYHDGGGDDQHHVGADCEALTLGAGDDLALGWFEDLGGNDTYQACKAAYGAESEKATGVFLDHSGNDAYKTRYSSGFGWVQDPADMRAPQNGRSKLRSTGVFADGAGTDTYTRPTHFAPTPIGDGKKWMNPWVTENPAEGTQSPMPVPVTYASPNICGVGLDR